MATKIEVCKPADLTMIAAIASRELEDKVTQETNGQFVVFAFENCSGFEMFKLGLCYQNLITQ
jgi:hypothetical protein